jgi:hypothetical protein
MLYDDLKRIGETFERGECLCKCYMIVWREDVKVSKWGECLCKCYMIVWREEVKYLAEPFAVGWMFM